MTSLNHGRYQSAGLVQEYLVTTLRPAEVMMFVKYRDEIAGRRIIDIGCGAGRVTRYLARWSPHVTGVDYSRVMIEYCVDAFPQVAFALCDARDLSRFPAGSFDAATFTYNGIDTLPHESRLLAFGEIHRILAPGGLFIFSSHNRHYKHARVGPRLNLHRNPISFLIGAMRFGRAMANRRAMKRMEREESEYAIINDNAHHYSLIHYYIDRAAQKQQIERLGFTLLEIYGEDGAVLMPGDDDSASGEIYYVVRRV